MAKALVISDAHLRCCRKCNRRRTLGISFAEKSDAEQVAFRQNRLGSIQVHDHEVKLSSRIARIEEDGHFKGGRKAGDDRVGDSIAIGVAGVKAQFGFIVVN